MSRYIDADDFFMKMYNAAYPVIHGYNEREAGLTVYGIAQLLDEQPTVDAVPIVRCKDCKHRMIVSSEEGTHYHYCAKRDHAVDTDYFCADGEKVDE